MTYLQSAFLGLVQGIAEFLPISSSGHLSLFQNFLGLQSAEETSMFFDVLLHLGTLIAVFIVYWRDIWEMILEFFRWIGDLAHGGTKGKEVPPARRMILLIIVGTLPLFLVLPIKDLVDSLYSNTYFIGFALLVTGTLLFVSDRMAHGKKTEKNATIVDALVVGCAQGLATVPGLSRSGTTIAAGLLRGYQREYAVRYSFLMSIPAVIGANILSLKDALEVGIDADMIPVYLVGVLVATVSGYFAIRLVNLLSDKGKFGAFAYYCWGVGVLALVLSFVL
ncbi:MAG: undecaprenyl-diphosphate phosphatase [Clostridiales bacterium]|nr:undecaprenyl-diphosphate phosphatase [Clostridiales bacterium]